MDAPYSGGTVPGGRLFVVDGDFTIASPFTAPEPYNPFIGDSQPSVYPIIILDRSVTPPAYTQLNVGVGINVQNFAANQSAIVFEQDFIVAQSAHVPLPLNTPYNTAWSVGWAGTYVGLGNCFLVEEGPLRDAGGGLATFKRKYANLPPNRNEFESFSAFTFPGLDYGDGTNRFPFSDIFESRIFYEYFVFDNLDLLAGLIPSFPPGHRINTGTLGTNAKFMQLEQTKFFKAANDAIKNYNLLDPDAPLSDTPDVTTGQTTTPSYTTYKSWQQNVELVVEASSFNRWIGNIFVRRTRFGLAL